MSHLKLASVFKAKDQNKSAKNVNSNENKKKQRIYDIYENRYPSRIPTRIGDAPAIGDSDLQMVFKDLIWSTPNFY